MAFESGVSRRRRTTHWASSYMGLHYKAFITQGSYESNNTRTRRQHRISLFWCWGVHNSTVGTGPLVDLIAPGGVDTPTKTTTGLLTLSPKP